MKDKNEQLNSLSTVMAWFIVSCAMLLCGSFVAAISVWLYQSTLQVLP